MIEIDLSGKTILITGALGIFFYPAVNLTSLMLGQTF